MMPVFKGLLVATMLLAANQAAADELLSTVDGRNLKASLVAADEPGSLTFQPAESGAASVDVSLTDLYRFGTPVESSGLPLVFVVGGSVLPAEVLKADEAGLVVRSESLGERTLPLECVRGLLMQPPADVNRRDALIARIRSDETKDRPATSADRLILANGDELSGVVLGMNSEKLELDADVGRLDVEVSRIAAIIFDPTLLARARSRGLHVVVGLADGSLIVTPRLIVDGERLKFTPLGLDGPDAAAWTAPLASLRFLQPFGGRSVYLSDLEPESYKHVPYLQTAWPYRADRSVIGTQLRARGTTYLKGLGVHSASRLTYRLDKPYRRFETLASIDDISGQQGSVTFRVFVDSEERFASQVVHGGDAPIPISVDVSGGQRVSLVVDFAERGDVLDRADWLDARLVE